MRFTPTRPPHLRPAVSVTRVMSEVLVALVPATIAYVWFFGPGILMNMAVCVTIAILAEAAMLAARGRPALPQLADLTAVVTAVLLAFALPPLTPWWVTATGAAFAIIFAKQLYGGLGYNPFNPAMAGYVILLISFPVQMTAWAPPRGLGDTPGLLEALQACFTPAAFDGVTMATPLDLMRQNSSLLVEDLWQDNPQFGRWAGLGWEWVNLAFLAGGAWLLYKRIFTWHAPLAMLASLALMAAIFNDGGSSASGGSPLFHLLSGATMFGAFFIVTDPVSSAVSVRGRLVYGAMIGVLVYIIRVRGNYPDAVAFAVLIMNFAAPFIDHYTQPRTYGHQTRRERD